MIRLHPTLLPCLIVAAIASTSAKAQTPIKKSDAKDLSGNIETRWRQQSPEFTSNQVPEKWKDRSGVILAKKSDLSVERELLARKLRLTEYAHFKIWVRDGDAVKTYSALYFSTNRSENGFAARVIKSNGSAHELDLSSAIKVIDEDDIPGLFRPYLESGSIVGYLKDAGAAIGFYKLAVPDLEPGDIIEYAWLVNGIVDLKGMDFYEMDPVYYLFPHDMPVVYQGYEFRTEGRCFFSGKSINGAPQLKESSDGKWDVYKVEDRDRDKIGDIRYVNKYLVLPLAKFQVVYARPGHGASKQLLIGEQEGMRKSVDLEELGKKTKYAYTDIAESIQLNMGPIPHMNMNFLTEMTKARKFVSPEEYAQKVYYVLRHEMLIHQRIPVSSFYFACYFREYLKRQRIHSDLIVTPRNNLTTIDHLLFRDELEWLVRVNGKYVYRFDLLGNMGDISVSAQGNTAYIIDVDRRGDPTPESIILPLSTADENKSAVLITASLDKTLQDLSVSWTGAFNGLARMQVAATALYYTNAIREDYKIYGRIDTLDRMEDMPKKEQVTAMRRMHDEMEMETKEKLVMMKSRLEHEYSNVIRYEGFQLLADGRTHESPLLKYSERYVLGDLVKPAGRDLLISLPMLIGGQTHLQSGEAQRQYDIDINYARTFRWRIIFDVPAGYTVGDVSDLSHSVDNAAGAFISTARLDKDQLILDVTKIYKYRNIRKEYWDLMRAFLDAAYTFSQKKVLLTPRTPPIPLSSP